MRVQVRIGNHYTEVLNHLEQYPQEYRGKRLLLLAAMQLAAQGQMQIPVQETSCVPDDDLQEEDLKPTPVKKTRAAPNWITQNAVS